MTPRVSGARCGGRSRAARRWFVHRSWLPLLASAALAASALTPSILAASARPPAGLDLEGRRVDPFEGRNRKATVLVFVRTDCPISNRYAPELQRLSARFAEQGVAFWLVYPDPTESADVVRKHVKEFGYSCGALRDPKHSLVGLAKARMTPEAAVFDPDRKLAYLGRIDDLFVDFGKSRPAPTQHDLESAVEAVLGGKPVPAATTQAIGCLIQPLK